MAVQPAHSRIPARKNNKPACDILLDLNSNSLPVAPRGMLKTITCPRSRCANKIEALMTVRLRQVGIVNVSSGGMHKQRSRVDDLPQESAACSVRAAYARERRGLVLLTETWAGILEREGVAVHAMHTVFKKVCL